VEKLAARRILGGVPVSRLHPGVPALDNLLLVAATETTTPQDIDDFARALAEVL
jgi:glycine dehydrogenase subunit 1